MKAKIDFKNKKNIFFYFVFFLLILLLNFFLYNSFDSLIREKDEESLLKTVSLIESFLEEKKNQVSNYAKLLARFPDLKSVNNDNLLKRRIYNLHSTLGVKGIQIFDENFNQIFEIGSGIQLNQNNQLTDDILEVVKEGYSIAFFSENDSFDIQVTSFTYIYDEYSIGVEGLISISESLKKDKINKISYDINGVIDFYSVDELSKDSFDNYEKKRNAAGKAYYLNEQKIENKEYLVTYLPVNNLYNNPIGYYTILVPKSSTNYLIINLLFINLFILILFLVKVKFNK